MKLLITGVFDWKDEYLETLRSENWDIVFSEREDAPLSVDAYEVDAVVCNWLFMWHSIQNFRNLKAIQLLSAGMDRVPLDYIKEKKISLFNAGGVYSIPMAEFALCGVLQLYKQSNLFFENKKLHRWDKQRNLLELNGKRILVIGTGSVGTEVGKRFAAFSDEIYGVDINIGAKPYFKDIFPITELDAQLKLSDVVILTLPLTDKTKGMFDEDRFSIMKTNSVFVNIARGGLVKETALIKFLDSKLYGAVLDVFENEPLQYDSALWDKKNLILTPHNSFVSDQNNQRMWELIHNNLRKYMSH